MNIIFMYKLGVFIKHNGIAKQYVGGRVDVKEYMTIIVLKGMEAIFFSCKRTKEHLKEE